MYFYRIGYGSYEDSYYAHLVHKNKMSDEELEALVHEAVIEVLKSSNIDEEYIHNYSDISDKVPKWLIKNRGFKELKLSASWACFGWPSLFDRKDWGDQRCDSLNKLTEALHMAGFRPEHDPMKRDDV